MGQNNICRGSFVHTTPPYAGHPEIRSLPWARLLTLTREASHPSCCHSCGEPCHCSRRPSLRVRCRNHRPQPSFRGEQKALENATHPKTQKIDCSQPCPSFPWCLFVLQRTRVFSASVTGILRVRLGNP